MVRHILPVMVLVAACAGAGSAPDAPPDTTVVPATPAPATTEAAAATPPVTTTVPETTTTSSSTPWALVVVGDFGTGAADAAGVAAAAALWVTDHPETAALVTTGDNFYVADAAAAWTRSYGWVEGTGLEVWPAPGNHDIESAGQWRANVAAFGAFPAWGTHRVGGLTLVILDSNQSASPVQRAWLEDTLADLGTEPWVAVFHHPWRSCAHHGSEPGVEAAWGDLLATAILVLNGHDHVYQRFPTERGWAIVTGGGGQALHELEPCPAGTPEPASALSAFHFLTISGSGGLVVLEAIAADGTVLDRVEMAPWARRP